MLLAPQLYNSFDKCTLIKVSSVVHLSHGSWRLSAFLRATECLSDSMCCCPIHLFKTSTFKDLEKCSSGEMPAASRGPSQSLSTVQSQFLFHINRISIP